VFGSDQLRADLGHAPDHGDGRARRSQGQTRSINVTAGHAGNWSEPLGQEPGSWRVEAERTASGPGHLPNLAMTRLFRLLTRQNMPPAAG
jgi:hypothetical protein